MLLSIINYNVQPMWTDFVSFHSPEQVGQQVPGFGGNGCWQGVMHCIRVSVTTPALQDITMHGSFGSVHSVPLSLGTPLYIQPGRQLSILLLVLKFVTIRL